MYINLLHPPPACFWVLTLSWEGSDLEPAMLPRHWSSHFSGLDHPRAIMASPLQTFSPALAAVYRESRGLLVPPRKKSQRRELSALCRICSPGESRQGLCCWERWKGGRLPWELHICGKPADLGLLPRISSYFLDSNQRANSLPDDGGGQEEALQRLRYHCFRTTFLPPFFFQVCLLRQPGQPL